MTVAGSNPQLAKVLNNFKEKTKSGEVKSCCQKLMCISNIRNIYYQLFLLFPFPFAYPCYCCFKLDNTPIITEKGLKTVQLYGPIKVQANGPSSFKLVNPKKTPQVPRYS